MYLGMERKTKIILSASVVALALPWWLPGFMEAPLTNQIAVVFAAVVTIFKIDILNGGDGGDWGDGGGDGGE